MMRLDGTHKLPLSLRDLTAAAARSTMRLKPTAVTGAPRSETKMKGEPSLSRRCFRSARSSRPERPCPALALGSPSGHAVLNGISDFLANYCQL
jgi:hypothetical protein